MKMIVISAAICAAVLAGTPLYAQDAENRALVKAGCLSASDTNPAKLKKRTAIRCFQKAIGQDPTGTLTPAQKQALLRGETSGAPKTAETTAPGSWTFVDDTARFYDPQARFSMVLSCEAEHLKLTSIASNVRAGNTVKLTIGTSSFEAVVDDGHLPMHKSVPATFSGRFDQYLGRLTSAARSGADITIRWPAAGRIVARIVREPDSA